MRGNPVLARMLLGVAVLMMMVPTFLYLAGPLRQPLMMDGDKIESRTCPDCTGSGKSCSRCRGAGFVDFLVPGPNRPTDIVGHIYGPDGSQVAAADVEVTTSQGSRAMKTDEQGRFGITLPPGNYSLKVNSPKGKLEDSLKIEVLRTPSPADRELAFPREDRGFTLK